MTDPKYSFSHTFNGSNALKEFKALMSLCSFSNVLSIGISVEANDPIINPGGTSTPTQEPATQTQTESEPEPEPGPTTEPKEPTTEPESKHVTDALLGQPPREIPAQDDEEDPYILVSEELPPIRKSKIPRLHSGTKKINILRALEGVEGYVEADRIYDNLAKGYNPDRANLTTVLLKARKDGLVDTKDHPDDGRKSVYALTSKGRAGLKMEEARREGIEIETVDPEELSEDERPPAVEA